MNQTKRNNKGRSGFNSRVRNRGPNTSQTYINNQNDELKQPSLDIYQNTHLVHSIISLLGCSVEVTVPNGTVFEGILKTVSQTLDVTLEMAHKIQKKNGHQKIEECIPSKNDIFETLVIGLKNIVSITARDVDLDEVKKSDNFTDQAISSRLNGQAGHERQLQKWEDPSGENMESIMLEDTSMKNGLDPDEMFATNEKKYGVKSSYDRDMLSYTTPVEGSKELEDKADLIAREIEQGNSFSDHCELDSGKTEEEMYSSVVRTSQGRTKGQGFPGKDESKQDMVAERNLPAVSPPKPQRVQQRERDGRLSDKTEVVNDQVKTSSSRSLVTPSSRTLEQIPQMDSSTDKPLPQVVSKSGIALLNIKEETKNDTIKEELKDFANNFNVKLAGTETAATDTEEPKKDTPVSVQQPSHKEQTPSSVNQEDVAQQRDSPKVQEQQRKTESPPKPPEEKPYKSTLNVNAKEFKPSQSYRTVQRTPPITPQPYHPVAISPTLTARQSSYGVPIRQQRLPIKDSPRSSYNSPSSQRFFETHGAQPMSAVAAAGSPIIAPQIPSFITVQGQPFPGMVPQMPTQGSYMIHPGGQGSQHFVVPQSVGSAVQSVAQTYPESSSMPIYANNIPLTPSSPYQGSPQPSPTTQTPFLPYLQQVIPQQQGSQPHLSQTVIAAHSPNQPHQVFVMPQPPQPVAMSGIPVSGQNPPVMTPFIPGQVGYAPRKQQPPQWSHPQQHPYPPGS